MVVQAPHRQFTVDEYYRMAEAGILTPDDRVELIEGEIVQMSPMGSRHAACIKRLT
ncbi:MAG: Uma2 family endonuclease, partial [Cyanobacteria bacterium J06555_12]